MLSDFRLWLCNHFINHLPIHFFRLAFYKKVMKFEIGENSSIHLGVKFNCAKNFIMGNNSTINQDCRIDNRGSIIIGDNVSISPQVKILTADHDIKSPSLEGRNRPINIHDYCFLGTDCIILGGINLAKGTVVSAGALLTKSTEVFGIYQGVPAIKKGQRSSETINYSSSYKRWFH